jgi:nitrite reductase/ring-hydroxylating ferredoxin subunit/uncharacterized membrane protein
MVDRLESAEALDTPAKAIGKRVRDTIPRGAVKDALYGTWLGHALHPVLTDVTIGSFLSATLLDLLGGDDGGAARRRLIGIGIAAAAPTALTGANDWADAEPASDGVRRAGLVHAASNTTALTFYAASLAARRRGAQGRGVLLALGGAAALMAGGYLGGHLSFTRGIGPVQTVYDPGPDEWTAVTGAPDLQPGKPVRAVVDETPVLLVRDAGSIRALHDRCSHRGCSLSETGEIEDGTIVCGCHGSTFDLRDGSLRRGPATAPQPAFEARERDGRIELRRVAAHSPGG